MTHGFAGGATLGFSITRLSLWHPTGFCLGPITGASGIDCGLFPHGPVLDLGVPVATKCGSSRFAAGPVETRSCFTTRCAEGSKTDLSEKKMKKHGLPWRNKWFSLKHGSAWMVLGHTFDKKFVEPLRYHGLLGTLFWFWFLGRDPLEGMLWTG